MIRKLSAGLALLTITLGPMASTMEAFPKPPKGTVPLYKLVRKTKALTLERYTVDRRERNDLVRDGWYYTGILCFVYRTPWPYEPGDTVPVRPATVASPRSAKPTWRKNWNGFPNLRGTWWEVGAATKHRVQISTFSDGAILATCDYGRAAWRMTGSITKDGKLEGFLTHTKGVAQRARGYTQTRIMQLGSNGRVLEGRATWPGGSHPLTWRR